MPGICTPRWARLLGVALVFFALALVGAFPAAPAGDDWPQFRGPDGQGHASSKDLPITWSDTENVVWKKPIPGLGWSSPVIRDRQVWLTTALDNGRTLKALCLDRDSGKVLHDVTLLDNNTPTRLTPPNSHASPSPIIADGHVYAHFGQYGAFCLTTAGKLVWKTTLPHKSLYGPSSTPVVAGDLLIVPCYGTDVQYLAALDRKTGKLRWKKPHDGRNSESTPLVLRVAGANQVITTSDNRVTAHDAVSGKETWWAKTEWGYALVPRPVSGHGLVFVCGGYFNPTLYAIRPTGKGDVTSTHVAWSTRRNVPNNPSPLLAGSELYLVNDGGFVSCLDAKSGKLHWSKRLTGTFYASPLFAAGRLYFSNQQGETTVVAAGATFRKLAVNRVKGRTLASLAVSGRSLFLRTDTHLYRIEKP
jgi:outer membrane protein assembly factor BamB